MCCLPITLSIQRLEGKDCSYVPSYKKLRIGTSNNHDTLLAVHTLLPPRKMTRHSTCSHVIANLNGSEGLVHGQK